MNPRMNERPSIFTSLFRRYAEGICYHPKEISIRELERGNRLDLFVTVHSADIGLLCGTNACNIKALKSIFGLIAARQKKTFHADISKIGDKKEKAPSFKVSETWYKTNEAMELIRDTFKAMGAEVKLTVEDYHDLTIITADPKIQEETLITMIDTVIHAWGKSQGRKITFAKAGQVKAA